MTFEAALTAALLTLNITTPVPVDRMSSAWTPRWAPRTLSGQPAAAWAYERDVVAVGVNIEWEESSDEETLRRVAAHEACHLKLHMKWIKVPAHTITKKQNLLNEIEAEKCAMWVMGVQAGAADK